MATLADRSATHAAKADVADKLFRVEDCDLDEFSKWVRSKFRDAQDLLNNIAFIEFIFRQAPATNVHSEGRFSLHARHQKTSQGNAAQPSTVCSSHVLAESKTVLDAHVWRSGSHSSSMLATGVGDM